METLFIIAVCILLNALLAGVEMAFVAIGKPHLRLLAKSGDINAIKILKLRANPERTLSVIQIGITLVGIIGAAVGGAGAHEWMTPFLQKTFGASEKTAEIVAIAIVVVPLTYLSVVLGELVPKTIALRNPLRISLRAAKWLDYFDKALSPFVWILERSTKLFLKVFLRRSNQHNIPQPKDPLEIDHLSREHQEYVVNLVKIESKRVRDIMVPWEQTDYVELGQSISDVSAAVLATGHTRLPVVRLDTVIGVLNTKEFMLFHASGAEDWDSIVRPLVRVHANDTLLVALKLMKRQRSHMAIVFFGNARVGIVTLEDIVEEVIGDVFDEDDDGAIRRVLSTRPLFRSISNRAK